MAYGLYDPEKLTEGALFPIDLLIGVIAFCNPISERVRSSVFGHLEKDAVTELSRLHILDVTPKNTESYFISRALKLLKQDYPKYKAVITFADSTEGHTGVVYKATNAYFLGTTANGVSYYDKANRLRTARQNSVNCKEDDLKRLGWKKTIRQVKHRYLYLLGNKREKKVSMKKCLYELGARNDAG